MQQANYDALVRKSFELQKAQVRLLPLEAHEKLSEKLDLVGKSEGIRSPEVISGPTSVSEVGISVLGTELSALSKT